MITAALLWLKGRLSPSLITGGLVVVIVLLLGSAVMTLRARLETANTKSDAAEQKATRLEREGQTKDEQLAELQHLYATQQGIANEAHRKIEKLDDNRLAAAAASDRVFKRFDADLARVRAAAATAALAGTSPSADDPGLLSTELYRKLLGRARRLDERARQFGDIADKRGIAGETCERIYDEAVKSSASN